MTRPTASFELEGYLDLERRGVEEALGRALSELPSTLPEEILKPLRYGVETGGKRLRPVLCTSAYRAVGGRGRGSAIYDLAASLELVHAYSLMHDDLPCMDDADLRRGRPTPHRIFGEAATVVAGAALIPAAALRAWTACRAMGLEDPRRRQVVEELLRAAGAGGMVGGQLLDLLAEERSLDAAVLDDLHGRKTGALLTAALRMGGVAAGAREEQLQALDRYGRGVGLAFQITDDVLDATASAGILGKIPSDHELGKSTYVALEGVEGARERARREVEDAVAALRVADLSDPALEALARFVVDRER